MATGIPAGLLPDRQQEALELWARNGIGGAPVREAKEGIDLRFAKLKRAMQPSQTSFINDDTGLENWNPFGECRVVQRLIEQGVGQRVIPPLKAFKESTQ